jgi:hypothetical protein
MINRLRLAAVLALLPVFFLGLGLKQVRAFSVSPVVIDLEVAPGTAAQGKIQVTNTDSQRRTYYVSVQKFVAKGEDGQQDFLPEEDQTGLASWITPDQRSVTLQPGETAPFSYVVSVPLNAEPGGHYAALFFSDRPTVEGDTAVGVGAKVGVLFLLRVPGDILESARVESFRTTSERINRLPAYFELRVRNLGSVHLRPEGSVVIRNMFGSTVANVPANPRQAAVLPNSVRRFESAWANTFEEERGGFVAELKNEWKNFGIGRYTAEAQVLYGEQKQELRATTMFWVIPWRVIVVVIALLVLLIVLLSLYNRMVVRAALKKGRRA